MALLLQFCLELIVDPVLGHFGARQLHTAFPLVSSKGDLLLKGKKGLRTPRSHSAPHGVRIGISNAVLM